MANNKAIITAQPGKQELFIEREFDAPPEVVFKAFTQVDLYVQWLGPKGFTMRLEKFEPENGGSWRYIHKDKDGHEFAFHGVFHEVMPPEAGKDGRLIDTFEYEGTEKGHVSLETAKFESLPDERTKLSIQSVFQTVEDRDGMIESGMEKGINEGYERLDELLEEIK